MAVRSAVTGPRQPTRPAPPPPLVRPQLVRPQKSLQKASHSRSIFGVANGPNKAPPLYPRAGGNNAGKRKVPPPRPPPPKVLPRNLMQGQPPSYSEVMAELMQLPAHNPAPQPQPRFQNNRPLTLKIQPPPAYNEPSLIDLSTPPESPSPTQQSLSDGMSLNSYGSSSDNSVLAAHAPNSSSSSGFEDDFDPFSSPPPPAPQPVKTTPVPAQRTTTKFVSKPTVIRPAAPKPRYGPVKETATPPMPRVPPPALPPVTAYVNEDDCLPESPPELPPRPGQKAPEESRSREQPYAVALYEYQSTEPTDLSFQPDDHVYLEKRLNEEWLYGRCGTSSGMFPAGFVQVVVPLPEDQAIEEAGSNDGLVIATAVYTFVATDSGDLGFQEGDTIKIHRRVDQDWLYGECNGRMGHFPSSFVTGGSI